MNALLVHGWPQKDEYYDLRWPTPSNSHWFPWVSKQLAVHDIFTVSIEMPKAYYPVYEDWAKEFERYDITPETMLVGHSCGGGFLVRWLSEHPDTRVGKVVLVAPWVGHGKYDDFDTSFFDFSIDVKLAERTKSLILMNSTNDGSEVQESVKVLREKIPNMVYKELKDMGHFTERSMGHKEFPELLEELVG